MNCVNGYYNSGLKYQKYLGDKTEEQFQRQLGKINIYGQALCRNFAFIMSNNTIKLTPSSWFYGKWKHNLRTVSSMSQKIKSTGDTVQWKKLSFKIPKIIYFFSLQHCHLLWTEDVYKALYLSTAFCFPVASWEISWILEIDISHFTSSVKQLNHDINELHWVRFGLTKLKYVMKSLVSSESGEQPILQT